MSRWTTAPGKRKKTAVAAGLFFLFPFVVLLAPGCRSHCELVERDLRHKEREAEELRGELHKTAAFNQALQRQVIEFHQLPPGLAPGSCARPGCSASFLTAGVKEIVLGRQTGGYDDDRCPGDEALQVVLEPRDCDGSAIKAPGSLRITALQVTTEGIKQPLSCWELAPEELRRTWKSGLLSTGYYVVVPWKVWPTTEKLRVVVQFVMTDGRAFEADKDVTIKLTCEAQRKQLLPPGEVVPELAPVPRNSEEGPELIHSARKPKTIAEAGNRPLHDTVHILRPVPRD